MNTEVTGTESGINVSDVENIPLETLEGLEGQALIQMALTTVGEHSSLSVEAQQLLALKIQILLQAHIYDTLRQIQVEINNMAGPIDELDKRR